MIDETQDIEIVDVKVVEESPDVDAEQTIEVVEVSERDEIVVESEEAFAPLGAPNEQLKHTLLTELEVEDQHPIEAVIGLRRELDTINSLKSAYSNVVGVADYYEWQDGTRDAVGYFVSLVPHSSMIQICGGKDIFGVTVDKAGFIGNEGFEEVKQHDGVTRKVRLERDDTYSLVATSGFVEVRCESDVKEGDYVVSNEHGKAQKGESEYGYKVIDLETKHGVNYAVIALGVQADITERIGRNLIDLDERMDNAEANIASMMLTLDKNSDEIDDLKKDVDELQDLETQAQNAALTAEQAKAIATSAIASAESMVKEAVEEANKAFAEAVKVREEFEEEAKDMRLSLEDTSLELQEAKEDLWREQGNMQVSLNGVSDKFAELRHDLIPLYSWTSEDGMKSSISGFVAQANEDAATLGGIVEWIGDGSDSLAGFVAEATASNATVKALADYAYTDKDGKEHKAVAALDMYAQENEAAIKAIAGFDGNLAGLQAKVDANSAAVTALASHVIGDYVSVEKWDKDNANVNEIYYEKIGSAIVYYYYDGTEWKTASDLTQVPTISPSLVYYVKGNNLYYYYKDGAWQSTEKPHEAGLDGTLAGIYQIADSNSAQISMITDLDGEFVNSLAGIVSLSKEDRAEIDALAQYGYVDANGKKHLGAAGIMAEVDKNKASIEAIASFDGDIAGFKAQVDKNASYAMMLAEKVMGNCITIPLTSDNATKDILTIYYDDSTGLYWYYSGGRWNSTSDWNTLANAALNTNSVYYVVGSKLYWYYKDGAWLSSASAYDAGLSATIGGIQVVTDENSAKIKELTSWQGETKTSLTLIKQQSDANGASITLLAADIDKYSVGEYSQALGFKLEQAQEVLASGTIYVPTVSHSETYGGDPGVTYEFTKGNMYEWDGTIWVEFANKVWTFTSAPSGEAYPLWYNPSEGILYKLEEGSWIAVATLQGNSGSRAVSQIRQDTDSIALEVTNARGSVAALETRLTENAATVQAVASWAQDPKTGEPYDLATIKLNSEKDGQSLALLVQNVADDTGMVTAASIVAAVNNAGSEVTISADRIDLAGSDYISLKVGEAVGLEMDDIRGNIRFYVQDELDGKLDGYATTAELNMAIDSIDLGVYATKGELDDYATKSELSLKADVATLGVYAKTEDVDGEIINIYTELNSKVDTITLGAYAKTEDVDGEINTLYTQLESKVDTVTLGAYAKTEDINGEINSLYTQLEAKADIVTLGAYATKDDLNGLAQSSELEILQNQMSAKVSNSYSGNSFGWSLDEDGFVLTSNGVSVFSCDSSGITIDGHVIARDFKRLTDGLEGAWERIDLIAEELDFKLDASEYNSYVDRLDDYETRITANAEGLDSKVSQTTFEEMGTRVSQCESKITQQANLISAKVDASGGGEDAFFWWSLDRDGFYLGSEEGEVMVVTDNGLSVTGEVNATSGVFQNCTITDSCTINGTLTSSTICTHSGGDYHGSLTMSGRSYCLSMGGYDGYIGSIDITGYNGYGSIHFTAGALGGDSSSMSLSQDSVFLSSDTFEVWVNTWNATTLPSTISDRRKKNSIETFDDRYEVLFDSLVPVRYKYNDGTSNRYHSGFIAQEVGDAIEKSGLTRSDFAGMCIHAENTDEERWGLRYGEFVSINTWQIQKLKARVAELENIIEELQTKFY